MVGRNFWVVEEGGGWEVRQEGLPTQTTLHASRDEAWQTARARAKDCHGEAFLSDGEGGHSDYACFRDLPRKIKV